MDVKRSQIPESLHPTLEKMLTHYTKSNGIKYIQGFERVMAPFVCLITYAKMSEVKVYNIFS